MKKILILAVLVMLIHTGNAQMYKAKSWHGGPLISFGIHNRNYENWDNTIDYMGFLLEGGAYAGYSFTQLMGVQLEAMFIRSVLDVNTASIAIPAMFTLQFLEHQHGGFGFIYHHTILNRMNENEMISRIRNNSLSAIVEFSTLLSETFRRGNYVYFTGRLTKTRLNLRFGYALTRGSFMMEYYQYPVNRITKITYRPFFFEMGFRWDIVGHIASKRIKNNPEKKQNKIRNFHY